LLAIFLIVLVTLGPQTAFMGGAMVLGILASLAPPVAVVVLLIQLGRSLIGR
jgi:hypothetical protein